MEPSGSTYSQRGVRVYFPRRGGGRTRKDLRGEAALKWAWKNAAGFALTRRAGQKEKNTSQVQRWKSTGPGRVSRSPGLLCCMLRRSPQEYGSIGRLGSIWGWNGTGGDWRKETRWEAFATFWVRSERVVAVKMEGRNGYEKYFNRDAKFFQISLTNCPQLTHPFSLQASYYLPCPLFGSLSFYFPGTWLSVQLLVFNPSKQVNHAVQKSHCHTWPRLLLCTVSPSVCLDNNSSKFPVPSQ